MADHKMGMINWEKKGDEIHSEMNSNNILMIVDICSNWGISKSTPDKKKWTMNMMFVF